jgi:hypothetical protein
MGGACSALGEADAYKILVVSLTRRDHSYDLGINGRIILNLRES